METVCHERFEMESLFNKAVTGSFDGGKISSDGGVHFPREIDHRYHVSQQIDQALVERREPQRICYELHTLLKQRLYGIS